MRLREFQHYLREHKIDLAFFSHTDVTLPYFTQFLPSYGFLFITPRKSKLYVSSLDPVPKLKHISTSILKKGWVTKIKNNKVKRIAINKSSCTVSQKDKLRKLFPKAHVVDVSQYLLQLRSQKTPAEIKYIAKACNITTNAFNELVRELHQHHSRNLKTEQDVAFFLEQSIRRQGGEIAFPTIVAGGKNAAIPHHQTSTQKLHRGFLQLDFGAKYRFYCADMSRVIFLGNPTIEERKWYRFLLAAQEEGINQSVLNAPYKNIDNAVRKKLGKYSSHFIHSLGHGIGVEVHEAPSFFDKEKVTEKYVFTIEPGIYFPSKFGLRIEDTLVFDGKARILTSAPKALSIIPWP